MSTLDYNQFRNRFPQFVDEDVFSDLKLGVFYDMAQQFIDSTDSPCRVLNGSQLALALQYMTAHLLYIAIQSESSDPDDVEGGSGGGGDSGGFITSATIGEISVSKLAPPSKDGWDWWLNSSPYGSGLLALLQMLAAGGLSYGGLPEREGFRKIGGVFW